MGRWAGVISSAPFGLVGFVLLLALRPSGPLAAQARIHAQAIPLLTSASHLPGDESQTEFALAQPVLMLSWGSPSTQHSAPSTRFFARAALDGEGLTVPDGELAPGAHGEGFYDRRHPHTYLHELVAGAEYCWPMADGCRLRATVTTGKGFVAFGTDDPMSRPVVRYPVNHHLAQILERALVIARLDLGALTVERTWFTGDEPSRPSDWPNLDRGLDSRALRVTVTPAPGVELQYSTAQVESPEHREGAGPAQSKEGASLRIARSVRGRPVYLMAEQARTSESGGFFVFRSTLVEGTIDLGRHHPYLRLERTERPEEERTLDPYRSVRPHGDDNLIGRTRWTVWTAGYGVSHLTAGGRVEVRPFVEASLARVSSLEGVFDPESFYGSDVLPSLTLGVRVDVGGMRGMRMGRYGDRQDDHALMGH